MTSRSRRNAGRNVPRSWDGQCATATVGRIGRGWSFHLIGFWNPGRMSHPRPGTFSLQIRVARTPQTAQGHHLAVAKYDVL